MQDTVGVVDNGATIRMRLDHLHEVLDQALEIEGMLGEFPGEEKSTARPIGDGLIGEIEEGLDKLASKAEAVTNALGRIAQRL